MTQMFGEDNPQWKGDKVGYNALHDYVRERKHKPKLCERCHKRKAVDLANKSGDYHRELSDWEYLCRKCHMDSDGRNDKLRASGKSRRIPDKICEECEEKYHRESGMRTSRFCSRKCFDKNIKEKSISGLRGE